MGPTDYPDLLPVRAITRAPYYLTVSAIGTSCCSSPTRLTLFTSVSRQGTRRTSTNIPNYLITDGFSGWGKMVVRDGWKCG